MTDIDPETLDSIEADLRDAVGKDNAITSGELAARHVPDDGAANPTTREIVKATMMRERGLPIVSCASGYYIPQDRGTIDDELDSLRGRIAGIEERMDLLEDNWAQWTSQTRADGGEVVDEYSPDLRDDTPDELTEAEIRQIESDPVLELSDFQNGGDDDD